MPRALGSLRIRIAAAFVAALVSMILALGLQAVQQNGVVRTQAVIARGYLPLSLIAARLDRDRQRIETDLERLVRDGERPSDRTSPSVLYAPTFESNLAAGRAFARSARAQEPGPDELVVLDQVDAHFDRIATLAERYQRASTALSAGDGPPPETVDALRDAGEQLATEVAHLVQLVDGRVRTLTADVEGRQRSVFATTVVLTVIAVAFSTFLLAVVLVALRPIGRLTEEVQRLAEGEMSGRVEVTGTDEVATLAEEFNRMVDAIRQRDERLVERAEELQRLSRYLERVVDSLAEGLVVVEDGQVTLCNPAAERVWGVERGRALPEDLAPRLTPGRQEWPGPEDTQHEVRIGPFGDRGVVLVSTDVTEPNRTREQLARSERLALVGRMLAQVTHEVRNPLNALSLNAELLAEELGELDADRGSEAWDQLGTIASEIDRLTEVTGHYLQLARRPQARPEPEDVGRIAQEVARLLDAELTAADVALTVDAEPLPELLVDGNQIRQALLNVVRNAVEAGGRKLVLALRRHGEQVHLSLADDGPGMSAEELAHAADPFFSTKASGTGLGLAITKQIVEDHGGALQVESEPGRGTTIALVLPFRAAPEEEHVEHDPGRR